MSKIYHKLLIHFQCFCVDNTEGDNCETCSKGFYGDPRNNGRCFLQCQSRAVLKPVKSQGIGSFRSQSGTTECLWLLKLEPSISNGSLIHFDIEPDLNISCSSNGIFVFSSTAEFADRFSNRNLLSVVCKEGNAINTAKESTTGELAVYFRKTALNEGFNGIVTVHSCKLGTCEPPFACDGSGRCRCPDGLKG